MLDPLMYGDEEIVVYDIATLDTDPRIRLDLIATHRALYVVDSKSRQPTRIPYEAMASLLWGGNTLGWRGRFWVRFHDGNQLGTTMKRGDLGLGDYVQERFDALNLYSRHVTREDGRGATLNYRRFSERGNWGWNVAPDDEVRLDDPDIDNWVREQMRTLLPEAQAAAAAAGSNGIFHAAWKDDGTGALFTPTRDGRFRCALDNPSDGDDTMTHIVMDAAWDELVVAHGQPAMFKASKPTFVTITWDPPLPA